MKNLLIIMCMFFSISSEAGLVVDLSNAQEINSNDRYNIIGKKNGYLGAALFTDSASLTTLTVAFVGSQAKYHNQFLMWSAGETLVVDNHPSNSCCLLKANADNRQLASINYVANQLLDFMFTVDQVWDGPDVDWVVKNGNQQINSLESKDVYFWLGLERNSYGVIESLLLGLDDGGGWPTPDKDHDDLVVRLSGFGNLTFITSGSPQTLPSSVPVPGSAVLMFSAIAGLVCVMRKQKQ